MKRLKYIFVLFIVATTLTEGFAQQNGERRRPPKRDGQCQKRNQGGEQMGQEERRPPLEQDNFQNDDSQQREFEPHREEL